MIYQKQKAMLELRFNNEKSLVDLNPRDMMSFISQLVSESRFEDKKVHVNGFEVMKDLETDTMETVLIFLQAFRENEAGRGEMWVWKCYRAKEHSCSNSSFERLTTFKASKTLIALAALYNSTDFEDKAPHPYDWIKGENLNMLDVHIFAHLCNY